MSSIYTDLRKSYLQTWRRWFLINQRCDPEWRAKYIEDSTTYYGICDEWSREVSGELGFINFVDYVGEHLEYQDVQLHRKNTERDYGPNNTIFGDTSSRVRHSKQCKTPTARGLVVAREHNIPTWVYYKRLQQGWSIRRASTKPYQRQRTR